jgi:DNA mismatch repair protein MutS
MQISLGDTRAAEIADELRRTSVETLTPIEALNLLFEMKKRLED